MKKNDLWISYQEYVKLNLSRPQAHSKSKPKDNLKPTVISAGSQQVDNIKLRLKDQPIVAQGHAGQQMKSRGTEKEAEALPQQPIRRQETEREAQGQPNLVDGQFRQPIKSRLSEKGPEVQLDQPVGMKQPENEAPKQPQVLEGDVRQPIKSRLHGKESVAEGQKLGDQKEAENGQVVGRKLLNDENIQNRDEVEFEMEENKIEIQSIMPDLDIQPEYGKLLPWERDGTFDDIQKVRFGVKKNKIEGKIVMINIGVHKI